MADIAEGLKDVIKLGRGDPDLDTPAHIVKAGQEALAEGATHYTHPLGIPALRQAIADNIRAYGGADYAPENIVVTPGGQQAMFVIALGLLEPRRRDPRALPRLQPLPPGGRTGRGEPSSTSARRSRRTSP